MSEWQTPQNCMSMSTSRGPTSRRSNEKVSSVAPADGAAYPFVLIMAVFPLKNFYARTWAGVVDVLLTVQLILLASGSIFFAGVSRAPHDTVAAAVPRTPAPISHERRRDAGAEIWEAS